jgi:hypothetical protein
MRIALREILGKLESLFAKRLAKLQLANDFPPCYNNPVRQVSAFQVRVNGFGDTSIQKPKKEPSGPKCLTKTQIHIRP